MTTRNPPALLTPTEEETRVVLRALFDRLLEMEPARYNPLYVGPLRRAEPVVRALEEAAGNAGARVAVGVDAVRDGGSAAGVIGLVPLRAAKQVLADTSGRRWVLVGDVDPDRLPSALLARLDEVGLIYDTRQIPSPPSGPSPLSRALAAMVRTEEPWVLCVAAEQEMAAVVAAEAAVRLRVLGTATGAVWQPGPGPDPVESPFATGRRSALVAHLETPLPPGHLRGLLERARGCAGGLVLVASPEIVASMAPDVTDPAGSFVRATPEPVPEVVRHASWPPVREMLTGAPESGAERELISSVDTQRRALNQILRSAASWERTGFLLVFSPERFGWIAVDGGDTSVRGAMRLGDPPGAPSDPEVVLARIRAMSLWEGLHALYVAATDPVPAELRGPGFLVDTIDVDLRRTAEEVRDGRLAQHSLPPELPALTASRVARELLWWGQARSARVLLEAAERASPWGVDEELLLGYLSAERDPREAAARLQHAAHRLSDDFAGAQWDLQVDATLAALLLEVRAHPARARHAWGVVERWIESQGEEWVETARRAAVAYEIAARAGKLAEAARFRDRLLRLGRPGDALPAWIRSSDPLFSLRPPA